MNRAFLRTFTGWGGWSLIVVTTWCLYVIKPAWPHTVAHFPWLWAASPFFLAFLCVVAFYIERITSLRSLVYSLLLLTSYFLIEAPTWTLLEAFAGPHRGSIPFLGFLPFVGLMNLIYNSPAIAAFLALNLVRRLALMALMIAEPLDADPTL
jgi:hypothetical protein